MEYRQHRSWNTFFFFYFQSVLSEDGDSGVKKSVHGFQQNMNMKFHEFQIFRIFIHHNLASICSNFRRTIAADNPEDICMLQTFTLPVLVNAQLWEKI